MKNTSPLWGGNCKKYSTIRKNPHQEIQHSEHGESLKSRVMQRTTQNKTKKNIYI